MSRNCAGLFLHSVNSLFAVTKWWELQQIRVSAGGKGWYTVMYRRYYWNFFETLLKCNLQLQVLTWALTFIVAYSVVTLASSSWSSHKETCSMGSEFMSADKNHGWESVELTASALLFSAVAPSPPTGANLPYSQRPNYTLPLFSTPLCKDFYILVSSVQTTLF